MKALFLFLILGTTAAHGQIKTINPAKPKLICYSADGFWRISIYTKGQSAARFVVYDIHQKRDSFSSSGYLYRVHNQIFSLIEPNVRRQSSGQEVFRVYLKSMKKFNAYIIDYNNNKKPYRCLF